MKKVCLLILFIILIGIISLTIYTLTHQDIKGDKVMHNVKEIEKASTNMTENELSEIYNIELNGKRHRLKNTYRVTFDNKIAKINLTLYLDGFELLSMDIENNFKATKIEEIFNENIENKFKIEKTDIEIIKEDKDYLLISLKSNIDNYKEEYIVLNEEGKILLDNILVYEENNYYVDSNGEELAIFYDDEIQLQAKIEDNKIYSLKKIVKEDSVTFEEYVYTIKKNKVKKELINTYDNIKLKENKKST